MDNKLRTPFNGNDQDTNSSGAEPAPAPAPLANFDFDRDLDKTPVKPGPLLHQQPAPAGYAMPAKKGKKGLWMILVTIVVLAFAGAAGYFYWQTTEIRKQADDAHVQLVVARAANEKLRLEAEDAKAETIAPKKLTAAEQLIADKTAITDVITAKLHAPTKDKDVKLTINIMKQDDDFAYANAGPADGGAAAYILKKVGDEWVIIYSGQEKVPQTDIDAYTIPTDFQSGQ